MEKNKTNILILFLLLFTFSFDLFAQIKDVPVVKLFEKEYYKYDVKSRESMYSICKKFNVTEAEILSMNPFIINGLQAGQTLMIPVKINNISKQKEILLNKEGTSLKTTAGETKRKKDINKSVENPRITVLLPFASTANPGANERYIEFYEGFLLAVDSLKSLGLSFEVQTLESGDNPEAIRQAILTGKLNQTDYCIGGVTPEQITILSEWARKNQKILILPFSSRIPELENNPYLFQTITPHSYINDRLAVHFIDQIRTSNIVFLNSSASAGNDLDSPLIPKIKKELQKKGISFQVVNDDENLDALNKVLVEDRVNTVFPFPLTMNETNNLVTRLSGNLNAFPEKKITLMGYPDWQTMSKSYQKRLYELNTYIYSNFYADSQQNNVRDFQIQFYQTFGKNLLNTYPKYSMMGYDIAAYFIPRMVFEKSEQLERIPVITPLQNNFQFGAKNPISGAFNQFFYLIHYTPDNTVQVDSLK
ncbi:MAG: LysM peptidoglycan-binding domain-containing protein [Bacteroidales bacterium]|nr:LysM peptidoglycan-binding domain-containing protein [Bacteroidales bacterium]